MNFDKALEEYDNKWTDITLHSKNERDEVSMRGYSRNRFPNFRIGLNVRYVAGFNSYLGLNDVYTIEEVDVHAFHTRLYLEEVPGIAFELMDFEIVEE